MATSEGSGRIVGIPFMVAVFDSAGRDYVGTLTLIGCVANGVFWFLLPQVVTALVGRRLSRRASVE